MQQTSMNFSTPRAPPNDPERRGNIWQQHEQLQAMYSQLMEQNSQLVTERSQYQHENHNLHQQVNGQPNGPATTNNPPEQASSVSSASNSRTFNPNSSNRFARLNSFKSDAMLSPRTALQSIFPGKFNGGFDHSPDNSSQAESYEPQHFQPQQQTEQQYYPDYQQSGTAGSAIDQLGQLRAELAAKDEQIVHLQHSMQGLRQKTQSLQYTVDDADSHRRQVQTHNGELQMQLDSLLAEIEALRQGHSWGGDANHVHQLTQENVELNAQLAELSHRLETQDPESQGFLEQEAHELHDRLAQAEQENSELTVKLHALESQLRHEHSRELRRIESEKENRLLELKGEHETLISLLTEQNERLEAELREAAETARTAAAAAAASTPSGSPSAPSTPRDLSAEDERKVQGLKATILQLVEENKSLTKTHEHNSRLKHEVQQMMKVKAERKDLKQDNSKLQSEVRKMQRQLDTKLAEPAANIESDGKLQEQLQMLEDEKAALQEQLQQHVQRAAPAALGAAAPGPLQEGQQGYPQTWKLVDQLRNQNRQLIAEVSELRGGREGQQGATEPSHIGRASSGSILRRLGLKKPKDRGMSRQNSAAVPEPAVQEGEMHSGNSFNEGSVELSNQSQNAPSVDQAAPSEKAVEELLEVADERVSQAEQRAIKAEEAAQAQEGLIEQLCNENLKLGEEIQRLNTSMKLVKDLTEENSRLIRDNKQANASLDSMVKDNTDLTNRLFDIALQSPDDAEDLFDDAFADPAEVAERQEKKRREAAAREAAAPGLQGGGAKPAMDAGMKKRQEDTAAEVRAREQSLAEDEQRHQQLKEESKKQLETFERVKHKMSSSSTSFSLARERLQRANSGMQSNPDQPTRCQPVSSPRPEPTPAVVTPVSVPAAAVTPVAGPSSPFQAASRRAANVTPERARATATPQKPAVVSPAAELTPSKQAVTPPGGSRGPPSRQGSTIKAPTSPPLSHPALAALSSSKPQAEPITRRPSGAAGDAFRTGKQQPDPITRRASGAAGETALGGPLTPERTPSGRLPNPPERTPSGRMPIPLERAPSSRMPNPPEQATSSQKPVPSPPSDLPPSQSLKPIQTARSLSREGSLTRSESGNERLRQEADASRAEIWRKIQAAKLNNSQKQGGSSEVSAALPTSPTQGLVTGPSSQGQKGNGPQLPKSAPQVPTPKPALQQAAPKAGPQQAAPVQVTVQDQVDEAYLQFGPSHDIVSFMQALGYKDFTAARPDEEKMEQFKRALKLTRPAFAATRTPVQQEMANAVYVKLQSWVNQFVYKR